MSVFNLEDRRYTCRYFMSRIQGTSVNISLDDEDTEYAVKTYLFFTSWGISVSISYRGQRIP